MALSGGGRRRRRRITRLESHLYNAAEAVAWRLPASVRVPVLMRTLERPRRRPWWRTPPDYSLAPFVERKAVFVHVPKAAGVSVNAALFGGKGHGHTSYARYERIFGSTLRRYFVFTFVRDPFDRLESAWRFLRAGGMNQRDRRWADEHLDPSLDFIGFVERQLRPELTSWIHLAPQMRFLADRNGHVGPEFVGRYERLEEDFAEVCRRIGVGATLPRLNVTPRGGREPVAWTAAAIARVRDIYAEDFEALGYPDTPAALRSGARVTG